MSDGRNTCVKIARKYNLPHWAVYQVAHYYRFKVKLAHFLEAIHAILASPSILSDKESRLVFEEIYIHATAAKIKPKLKTEDGSSKAGTSA